MVKNTGLESTELEVLFNSVQIYESVTSITFTVFRNYPDAMKSINESLIKWKAGTIKLMCFSGFAKNRIILRANKSLF